MFIKSLPILFYMALRVTQATQDARYLKIRYISTKGVKQMLKGEYKFRVEELIHCESLQEQIHFYLRMFVDKRCNKNLRISIINMSSELAKHIDHKSVSSMLRNLPRGSVENGC